MQLLVGHYFPLRLVPKRDARNLPLVLYLILKQRCKKQAMLD